MWPSVWTKCCCPPPPHQHRFLPDKAIDLVDEAAAKLKMEITSKPEALDEIDRKVLQLEMERLSLQKV
jgi:ATP-dependent Clp protease ATP-binding subunit ClpB